MRKRGFTLIETLVVVAIVGVLLTLTLPALSGSRAQGRRIVCMNNLRQFHPAIRQYCDIENRGILPAVESYYARPGSTFRDIFTLTAPYLDAPLPTLEAAQWKTAPPYACPSDRYYKQRLGVSYHYVAGNFMTDPNSLVVNPALAGRTTIRFETGDIAAKYSALMKDLDFNAHEGTGRSRVYQAANVLFLDGHVTWTGGKRIPGDEPWLWPGDV